MAGFVVLFLLATVAITVAWLRQPGVRLDDEVGHFLISRDAASHPALLLNFWGRTATTAFFAPLAPLGLTAARALAVLGSLATAGIAARVTHRLGIRTWWTVPAFFAAQPWVLTHAHEVLTIAPAALAMMLLAVCLVEERMLAGDVVAGILPLVRHELAVVTGLWVLWRLLQREWRSPVVAALPLVMVNVATVALGGPLMLEEFLDGRQTDRYGSGGWGHFVAPTVDRVGWGILALAAIGAWRFRKRTEGRLLMLLYGSVFATHTVIYRFGLFKSGGFPEFVYPLAPMFAVLAAGGLEWLWSRRPQNNRSPMAIGLAALAAAAVISSVLSVKFPRLGVTEQQQVIQEASSRAAEVASITGGQVHATSVYAYLHVPLRLPTQGTEWYDRLWREPPVATAPACDVMVWDRHYSPRWAGTLQDLREAGWASLDSSGAHSTSPFTEVLVRSPCPPAADVASTQARDSGA